MFYKIVKSVIVILKKIDDRKWLNNLYFFNFSINFFLFQNVYFVKIYVILSKFIRIFFREDYYVIRVFSNVFGN